MDTQRNLRRRGVLAAAALGTIIRPARGEAPSPTDPWPSLAAQIFGDRPIADGSLVLAIDAPYRAADAAVVPITIRTFQPTAGQRAVRAITLTIDENPSPLAAVFSPGAGSGMEMISTRVRVDSYTNLHATAELDDKRLYASARFVKAAGGCSAPAAKMATDAIPLGAMRFRQFPPARPDGILRQAQLMIRHPNYTGMQMDQLTRLYTPALFVKSVRIWQGDQLLLSIESGISISENPEFRFDYRPNGAADFRAEVADSTGRTFQQAWPAGGA
jgi:sulfur-oxidizing protein SoxY